MAMNCPNCGRPIRPGAKFCGYCKAELSKAVQPNEQAKPAPAEASAAAPAEEKACPHCGKPVRASTRFCPSCGKAVAQPPTPPTPSPLPPPSPVSPGKPAAKAQGKPSPLRSAWFDRLRQLPRQVVILVSIAIGVCCLTGVLIAIAVFDLFGSKVAPVPTFPPTSVGTASPIVTSTVVPSVTPTFTETPTPSPTLTLLPATTETSLPPTTPAALTTPGETGVPSLRVLFEENFNTGLDPRKWFLWGQLPAQQSGDSNPALLLSGETEGAAGVTVQTPITLSTGLVIVFNVKVDVAGAQNVILFNWDPVEVMRQPNRPTGPLLLKIGNGWVRFEIKRVEPRGTIAGCELPLGDTQYHNYQIKIGDKLTAALVMDGIEVCSLPDTILANPADPTGRISFSGRGLVDDLRVTVP